MCILDRFTLGYISVPRMLWLVVTVYSIFWRRGLSSLVAMEMRLGFSGVQRAGVFRIFVGEILSLRASSVGDGDVGWRVLFSGVDREGKGPESVVEGSGWWSRAILPVLVSWY